MIWMCWTRLVRWPRFSRRGSKGKPGPEAIEHVSRPLATEPTPAIVAPAMFTYAIAMSWAGPHRGPGRAAQVPAARHASRTGAPGATLPSSTTTTVIRTAASFCTTAQPHSRVPLIPLSRRQPTRSRQCVRRNLQGDDLRRRARLNPPERTQTVVLTGGRDELFSIFRRLITSFVITNEIECSR